MQRTVVFDTESTGFSPQNGDRLIELAAIELVDWRPTGRTIHGLYWPQRQVPKAASDVHGWTTEKLRGKPLFQSHAAEIAAFFEGAELWAHNAAFDRKFLNTEMGKAGHFDAWEVSCSLQLARQRLKDHSHKLVDLARWAGHTWTGAAHGAMADTRALVDVLLKLRQLPAPQAPAKKTKATGLATPGPAQRAAAPARTTPSALAPWTGPVAPANDPRVARVDWSGHPFAQGKPWGTDEDALLRTAFLDGANLLELARTHGRTPAALALRLERQGLVAAGHPYAQTRWRS
jgi:DNA polymerase III subunit epsilon